MIRWQVEKADPQQAIQNLAGELRGVPDIRTSDWERANASDQSAAVHDDIGVFQCPSMPLSLRRYALFRPARNPYRGATLLP